MLNHDDFIKKAKMANSKLYRKITFSFYERGEEVEDCYVYINADGYCLWRPRS